MKHHSYYNKRRWLNKKASQSTGSIVCYNGTVQWNAESDREEHIFVEVADCHNKVRLHKMTDDSLDDFIDKITLMSNQLTKFAEHLRKHGKYTPAK